MPGARSVERPAQRTQKNGEGKPIRGGSTASLWAAMRQEGYRQEGRGARNEWPGLSMTGPAAVDYLLAGQPSLL